MSTSQKWRLSQLVHIPLFFRGRSRCRSQYPSRYRPFSRRGHRPLWFIFQLLISPKVSNLDSLAQNQVSCQLDEGRILRPICQRTFSFEVSIRFELMTPGYKAGILPTILRDQYKTKNPRFLSLGFYIPKYMLLNVFNS